LHGNEPLLDLNVPGAHASHPSAPPSPVNPWLQMQFNAVSLPFGDEVWLTQTTHVSADVSASPIEKVSLGQRKQDAEPFAGLNVPPTHAGQELPSIPVYPALQMQSV